MILRYLGYVGFFFAAFVISTYLTFPWGAVKQRVLQYASKASGRQITAQRLEPSWLTGFSAKKVEVEIDPGQEPFTLRALFARAYLLDFLTGGYGGYAEAPIGQGTVEVDVSGNEERVDVEVDAEGVEIGLVPAVRMATGLALGGTLGLDVDLDLGLKDPKTSAGQIRLRAVELETLEGSEAKFPVPALVVGDLDWNLPVEDGKVIVRNQRLDGPNLSAALDGEIVLAQPMTRSLLNLTIQFRPTEAFLAKEPLLGQLLNNLNRYKNAQGFYGYQVSGTLKRPRFTPRRL